MVHVAEALARATSKTSDLLGDGSLYRLSSADHCRLRDGRRDRSQDACRAQSITRYPSLAHLTIVARAMASSHCLPDRQDHVGMSVQSSNQEFAPREMGPVQFAQHAFAAAARAIDFKPTNK